MINSFRYIRSRLFYHQSTKIDQLRILSGKILANQIIQNNIILHNIQDAEFQVFSQFGEDGIIQYLINKVIIEQKTFVEFGVENYTESNTRFLLINNNWTGLVMDGDEENIKQIKSDNIYWKYDLRAIHAFVNKQNINDLLLENGFFGEIGLLSIDIDGNDYYIWEVIKVANPVIVIVEYNSVFGLKHAISIPYDPFFVRTKAHYSNLFWGCSLKSLCILAEKKGYAFVGSNSAGNNAFFIRKDKLGELPQIDISKGYVKSKYRESRDIHGRLNYISGNDRIKVIEDRVIYNIESSELMKISELVD